MRDGKREDLVEDPGFTTRVKLYGFTHPRSGVNIVSAAEYIRKFEEVIGREAVGL